MRSTPTAPCPPWMTAIALMAVVFMLVACGSGDEQLDSTPSADGSAADSPPAEADAEALADIQTVIDAHQALTRAYEVGDVDSFVGLLDDSPELSLFHPRLENRFTDREAVRTALGRMFGRLGRMNWTEVHPTVTIHDEVAWLTSHLVLESENLEVLFVGRSTEIWVRSDGPWRLRHGHWSDNPEILPEDHY